MQPLHCWCNTIDYLLWLIMIGSKTPPCHVLDDFLCEHPRNTSCANKDGRPCKENTFSNVMLQYNYAFFSDTLCVCDFLIYCVWISYFRALTQSPSSSISACSCANGALCSVIPPWKLSIFKIFNNLGIISETWSKGWTWIGNWCCGTFDRFLTIRPLESFSQSFFRA